MYNCFDIAKEFLSLASKEGKGVDTMKLLKLTYIAHGYYLSFFDKPLFSNQVQAWKYGPVIQELYWVIKRFGVNFVDPELLDLYSETPLKDDDRKFIQYLWDYYKGLSGQRLSAMTHQKGTPWSHAYVEEHNVVIPNETISAYYSDLIKDRMDERQSA